MTEDEFAVFLAKMVHEAIEKTVKPLRAELDALRGLLDQGPVFDGQRTLTIAGKEFKLPVPIYKGTYSRAARYEVGDLITSDGNMFSCCRTATNDRPGTGDGWVLCVRKGREAR